MTDWNEVVDAARWTVNKSPLEKEPSSKFKSSVLMAEHSPIRNLWYKIEMHNIPSWVSQHLARHDNFAYHTVREGTQESHFVGTQRGDRTGVDRNKKPQDAPVNHLIIANASDIIHISRLRLCMLASPETRAIWKSIVEEIRKIDAEVASMCVPNCVYRGRCPEMKCCGYYNTQAFTDAVNKYWEQISR